LTEQLIGQLGYIGIAMILILGGLGLPIPEEAPIIVAAVLSRNGQMTAPLAFVSCLSGVLVGDFVVYGLGYFYGEKVLSFRVTQRILTRQREAQIKGYFQRHGFKILVSGRFVPGFRTAAYLTAGILKLPPLKLLITDLVAATLSTSAMFGLGYAFAYHIQSTIQEAQRWLAVLAAFTVSGWLFWRYYQARKRAGQPVGPPVLDTDDVPLPDEPIGEEARGGADSGAPTPKNDGPDLIAVELKRDAGDVESPVARASAPLAALKIGTGDLDSDQALGFRAGGRNGGAEAIKIDPSGSPATID
jgi:membrane protein DedA with SNARE-associated domain